MPHSTIASNYTRSNYSSDRSRTSSAVSTPATSGASTPQLLTKLAPKPSVKIKPRKSRPKPPQPGDWHNLLGIPPEQSNTPYLRSSLQIAHSCTDLAREGAFQNKAPPGAMGGNRTSLSMNGGLDPKRRTTSYDEQYQYKDNAYSTARERVHRESPIIAELRTNVIVSIRDFGATTRSLLTDRRLDQR